MRLYIEVTVVGVIVLLATHVSALAQGSFGYLRGPPNGQSGDSLPYAISADGSTVVGQSSDGNYFTRPFRLRNSLFNDLRANAPSGFVPAVAYGVSGDGSVVVGYGYSFGYQEAFRWENGVATPLGDLQDGLPRSVAYGVSATGSVVVGYGFHAPDSDEAFRWENGVMVGLGDLPGGGFFSRAYAISTDGTVIVGESESDRGREAFRWENGVMVGLGTLPGDARSWACAVSSDGQVVVGHSFFQSGSAQPRAVFRWKGGVMVLVASITDTWLVPDPIRSAAVSADGSIISGTAYIDRVHVAFLWDEQHGARKLRDILAGDWGLNVPGFLQVGTGVSGDGLRIVGCVEYNPFRLGWIAQLPNAGPSPDVDGDGVPDYLDTCPHTVPGATVDPVGCPPSIPGDLDRDGDVDLMDHAILQRCMSGADEPGDPDCDTLP